MFIANIDGSKKYVLISAKARKQFTRDWQYLNPKTPITDVSELICKIFNSLIRTETPDKRFLTPDRKPSLFFVNNEFTFVVRPNPLIITSVHLTDEKKENNRPTNVIPTPLTYHAYGETITIVNSRGYEQRLLKIWNKIKPEGHPPERANELLHSLFKNADRTMLSDEQQKTLIKLFGVCPIFFIKKRIVFLVVGDRMKNILLDNDFYRLFDKAATRPVAVAIKQDISSVIDCPISYINKKGNTVSLTVSEHAKRKFLIRWRKLHPDKPIRPIKKLFDESSLVTNYSHKEERRLKRYGKDTLYFRCAEFTFVVQNAIVKTIEISKKDHRKLNKKPLPSFLS